MLIEPTDDRTLTLQLLRNVGSKFSHVLAILTRFGRLFAQISPVWPSVSNIDLLVKPLCPGRYVLIPLRPWTRPEDGKGLKCDENIHVRTHTATRHFSMGWEGSSLTFLWATVSKLVLHRDFSLKKTSSMRPNRTAEVYCPGSGYKQRKKQKRRVFVSSSSVILQCE